MNLYMRRKPQSVSQRDVELIALSDLLSRRALGGTVRPTGWRSPDGLRARMSVFRVLDPGVPTRDTKRAEIASRLWRRFEGRAAELAAAAETIRYEISATLASSGERGGVWVNGPSRGPLPWSGTTSVVRDDGECWVYVLVLEIDARWSDRVTGAPYIKVGRSNDVARRVQELNEGFPSDLGLAWRIFDTACLPSSKAADECEQRLLHELYLQGVTTGGEFARAEPAEIAARLRLGL